MYEYFLISHLKPSQNIPYTQKVENLLNVSSILSGISVFNSLRNNTSFYGNIVDVTNEGIVKVQTDYGVMEMASDLILFQTGMQLQFTVFKKHNELLLHLLSINNQPVKNFIDTHKLDDQKIIERNVNQSNQSNIAIDIGNIYAPTKLENIRSDIVTVLPKPIEYTGELIPHNLQSFKEIIPEEEEITIFEKIIFDLAKNTDIPELIAIMSGNPENQDIKRMIQLIRNFINIQVQFKVLEENPDLDTPDAIHQIKEISNELPNEVTTGHTKNANEIKTQKIIHDNIQIAPHEKHDNTANNDDPENSINTENLQVQETEAESDQDRPPPNYNKSKDSLPTEIRTAQPKPQKLEVITLPNKTQITFENAVLEAKPTPKGFLSNIGFIETPTKQPAIQNNHPQKILLEIENMVFSVPEKKVTETIEAINLTSGFKHLDKVQAKLHEAYSTDPNSIDSIVSKYDEDSRNLIKLFFNIPDTATKKTKLTEQVQNFINQIKNSVIDANTKSSVELFSHNFNIEDLPPALHEIGIIKSSLDNIRETQDWKVVPLPIIYHNQIINLNFYIQNEREPHQSQHERPSKSLFKIEANDTIFGNIIIDGNIHHHNTKKFIDISLYAENEVDKESDHNIREVFNKTIKDIECDGRIKIFSKKPFEHSPKSFIKNLLNNLRV